MASWLLPDYIFPTFKNVTVDFLKEKGIVNGTETGNFEPARFVTRAEFIKMPSDISLTTNGAFGIVLFNLEDGKTYKTLFEKKNPDKNFPYYKTEWWSWKGKAKARYIRLQGDPVVHGGWIFVDEIIVK